MKSLVVVDVQNDFIDGSLGTPEAQAIVPRVEELISSGNYDFIYYTFDTHYNTNYMNTLEGKKLPVLHCIKGTHGWNTPLVNVNFNDDDNEKNCCCNLIEKHTFGSFKLLDIIRYDWKHHNTDEELESITIIGLCTDICVIANAVLLRTNFPNIPIICDASACAGTTPERHKAALDVMKSLQIDIINES